MFEFAVIFVAVGIAVSLTVHGYFVKKKTVLFRKNRKKEYLP